MLGPKAIEMVLNSNTNKRTYLELFIILFFSFLFCFVVEFPHLLKIPLVPLAPESLRRTPVPARQERIHSTRDVQEVQ